MDCFSRRELGFFIAYSEDEVNTIFRYRPYSRKADKHKLWVRTRRHGYTIENPTKSNPEFINNRIQYSTNYKTNIPWEWYKEPSFFSDYK
jgi:hypothetical protein